MKNVIFMGAGASKADGVPLQSELFSKFFEMCDELEDKSREMMDAYNECGIYHMADDLWHTVCHYKNKKYTVKNFLVMYFGDIINTSYPSFEEVLALIEISTQRMKFFGVII